jgi:hypothetical protein
MAYWDALVAKWAQAPAGTNDQKLTWVNAQTVTGPAIKMIVPATEIYNRTDRGEYDALTNLKQQPIQRNLALSTIDFSPGSNMRALWLTTFPAGTKTQINLKPYTDSFDTPKIPWWQSAGYPHAITGQDLVSAGIQTAPPVTPLSP